MPSDDSSATRVIPFYSLRLGDLVVSRGTLIIHCHACSHVARVPVIPVLSKFGHRYGVKELERVHVCNRCQAKAHGFVTVDWL